MASSAEQPRLSYFGAVFVIHSLDQLQIGVGVVHHGQYVGYLSAMLAREAVKERFPLGTGECLIGGNEIVGLVSAGCHIASFWFSIVQAVSIWAARNAWDQVGRAPEFDFRITAQPRF
ncbi:TPA: hypothetical protein L4R50_000106 [Pseudomonas aeruginosa]|nr:hypothetical protein [Pseudomonas aeruginosa]